MAPGLPDRVDVARLADDAAILERTYPLDGMARLRDLLAEPTGCVRATFAFKKVDGGRSGARIAIRANPRLVCQRCLKGFEFPAVSGSEVEFAASEAAVPADSEREAYMTSNGSVSLKDLAEEELLLALPFAPACSTPLTCGNAPAAEAESATAEPEGDMRRPFAGLQEMLKKTR